MITYIKRITGAQNSLVQINTTDTTAVAIAANYITAQAVNIIAANEGGWTWQTDDTILLCASDGVSWCVINNAFTSLISIASNVYTASHVYSASFTLTAVQFDGMEAAPVQVLAAQGAGTIIVPELISMELVYGSAAFAAGGAVGFQYGNTAALAGTKATNTEQATDFTGASANTLYNFYGAFGNGSQLSIANAANAALYISNATAPFTGGTGGVFNGNIFYRIIPVV